ncbi:AmmeMemoRadiSam system protein B [Candidatus Woesearchaeota archaeon]|nr:AmmeMemoRadiSam system protein B [Candidatus Woesearchaeota archaeon]
MNHIEKQGKRFRMPAVAGSFYPADRETLKGMIKKLFEKAKKITKPEEIHGIIVPHAGYVYSGYVAAAAYSLIDKKTKKVCVLGPSHREYFNDALSDEADFWLTPLGEVKITGTQDFVKNREAHMAEHSLEVQIPFLQTVLDKFELLPLCCGHMTNLQCAGVAEKLAKMEDALFVISTDLSHFEDQKTANLLDKKTNEIIEDLDIDKIDKLNACGQVPVMIAMHLCRIKGWKMHLIDYMTSGDITGDKTSVVGYSSFWF